MTKRSEANGARDALPLFTRWRSMDHSRPLVLVLASRVGGRIFRN
jgi:hypothetical protein